MRRRKYCRRCNNYAPSGDGETGVCRIYGTEIRDYSLQPPEMNCWRKHVAASGAELSAILSAAGKRGGRPKGSGTGRTPTKNASLWEIDYNVLTAYSQKLGQSLRGAVHKICKSIINQYPDTRPDGWRD